jgi:hypothetical protein
VIIILQSGWCMHSRKHLPCLHIPVVPHYLTNNYE